MDLLDNSIDKDYLSLSDEVFTAIKKLKAFNYEHIYSKANTLEMEKMYEDMFRKVFKKCLSDIKTNNREGHIFTIFLNDMNEEYINNTTDERKVIDYIAGMTDDFIVSEYNNIVD